MLWKNTTTAWLCAKTLCRAWRIKLLTIISQQITAALKLKSSSSMAKEQPILQAKCIGQIPCAQTIKCIGWYLNHKNMKLDSFTKLSLPIHPCESNYKSCKRQILTFWEEPNSKGWRIKGHLFLNMINTQRNKGESKILKFIYFFFFFF